MEDQQLQAAYSGGGRGGILPPWTPLPTPDVTPGVPCPRGLFAPARCAARDGEPRGDVEEKPGPEGVKEETGVR